jgi:hypothetical protein
MLIAGDTFAKASLERAQIRVRVVRHVTLIRIDTGRADPNHSPSLPRSPPLALAPDLAPDAQSRDGESAPPSHSLCACVLSLVLSAVSLDASEAGARGCYTIYAKAEKMGSLPASRVRRKRLRLLAAVLGLDRRESPTAQAAQCGTGDDGAGGDERGLPSDDPKAFGTCRDK